MRALFPAQEASVQAGEWRDVDLKAIHEALLQRIHEGLQGKGQPSSPDEAAARRSKGVIAEETRKALEEVAVGVQREMGPWVIQVQRWNPRGTETLHIHFHDPNTMRAKAQQLAAWVDYAFYDAAKKYGCLKCSGCSGPVVTKDSLACGVCGVSVTVGLDDPYPLEDLEASMPITPTPPVAAPEESG